MVVMIALIVALPALSGVASYDKNPEYLAKKKDQSVTDEYTPVNPTGTYLAPDEVESYKEVDKDDKPSTGRRLRDAKLTGDDIPVKLRLQDADLSNLRKRGSHARHNLDDKNPNQYDYDLDQLIEEELQKDRIEANAADYNEV